MYLKGTKKMEERSKLRNTNERKMKTEGKRKIRRRRKRIGNERKKEIRQPNTIYYYAFSAVVIFTNALSQVA